MIKVEKLTKSYRKNGTDLVVLENLSFEVKTGEFLSLVGPTGCGKTTLLNIIAGLERPTSGKVLIRDREVNSPGLDRGVVFQEAPLFPWKTVSGNVELALKAKGVNLNNLKESAREYLETVDLVKWSDHYPKELSGGMKQKAALAKALAQDPEILLLDEPFGALDAQTRIIMQEELLKIWERFRKTILLVTHSIDESIFLSDRIIVLSARRKGAREMIEVTLPRPRRPTEKFWELRTRIWEIIRSEVMES
ncbi:MAG: ABC transporter ATP-binding protein [bacterium]|nr:ABC transporter ATP-binding protein [bacterium]